MLKNIGMDNQQSVQQPTVIMTAKGKFFSDKRMRLKILLALVIILALLFYIILNTSDIKKILPVSPTPLPIAYQVPLELITQGIVSEIKADSLVVKEKQGLQKQVFIDKDTPVTIQKVSLPSAKKPASGEAMPASSSALLISTLASNEQADITKIKSGDEVKIVITTRNNQAWAKRITVIREIVK